MDSVTLGQKVRSVPGFEDTLLPGYEGTVFRANVLDDGTVLVGIKVTRLPSGMDASHLSVELETFAHKLEPVEE